MEFASLSGALRATRRFHAAYGMQGARYKPRKPSAAVSLADFIGKR